MSYRVIYGSTFEAAVRAQVAYLRDQGAPPPLVNRSLVEGGWSGAGVGNVEGPPRFVNADSRDYRLLPNSPAIDAGDNAVVQPGDTDIDGRPRTLGLRVDMGAYERCPSDVDFDDAITMSDLNELLDAWGTTSPTADLNGDGIVDFTDLELILDAWGDSCLAP